MKGFSVHQLPTPLKWHQPDVFLSTGFGSGLIRPASGTWGSFACLAVLWAFWPDLPIETKCGLAILFSIIGLTVLQYITQRLKRTLDDSSWIVIDEWAGLAIALIPAFNPMWMIGSFALFRFFDVLKPFPISWVDKNVKGAAGIMIDDLVAGAIAALVMLGIQAFV